MIAVLFVSLKSLLQLVLFNALQIKHGYMLLAVNVASFARPEICHSFDFHSLVWAGLTVPLRLNRTRLGESLPFPK